jgi:DNA-binding CsgD family transcriptional regulator
LQAASAADVTEQLKSVAAPTLVLHRRGMTQLPAEVARTLAMDLPRGRLVVLDGAQPALFTEDPGAVVSLLADFICDGIAPAEVPPAAAARAADGGSGPPPDGLSRRELEVLRLLAAGESNPQIARRLGLSTHTVERHVANLYRKIGARGRADATAHALRHDLA